MPLSSPKAASHLGFDAMYDMQSVCVGTDPFCGSALSLELCVVVVATTYTPCKEMPLKLKKIAWVSHLLI